MNQWNITNISTDGSIQVVLEPMSYTSPSCTVLFQQQCF